MNYMRHIQVKKIHKPTDKAYQIARQTVHQRKHRKYVDKHDYNQKYYAEHSQEIKQHRMDKYNTKKNTIKCRKYRKSAIGGYVYSEIPKVKNKICWKLNELEKE